MLNPIAYNVQPPNQKKSKPTNPKAQNLQANHLNLPCRPLFRGLHEWKPVPGTTRAARNALIPRRAPLPCALLIIQWALGLSGLGFNDKEEEEEEAKAEAEADD